MTATENPTTETETPSPPRRRRVYQVTDRDVAIVDAIARHRFLSTGQIAALFFPTQSGIVSSYCRSRLRCLTTARFLTRFERPVLRTEGTKSALFGLAAPGRDLLVSARGYELEDIDWRPSHNDVSWAALDHQIMINDIFIALSQACARVGWTLADWVDDRILKKRHAEPVPITDAKGKKRWVLVVPDAYFELECPDPSAKDGHRLFRFFVEADRATMTVISSNQQRRTWQKRVKAYQAYFKSEQIIKTYGTREFRVLTVTTSPRRLESLKAATEAASGLNKFWFTTEDALSAETALESAIWHKAGSVEPVSLRMPE